MAKKKPDRKVRGRTKAARDIMRAVELAGGSVTITSKNHLRVVGPAGIAIICSDPENNSLGRSLRSIKRHAGLDITL